jgi:hypothetical protein
MGRNFLSWIFRWRPRVIASPPRLSTPQMSDDQCEEEIARFLQMPEEDQLSQVARLAYLLGQTEEDPSQE